MKKTETPILSRAFLIVPDYGASSFLCLSPQGKLKGFDKRV